MDETIGDPSMRIKDVRTVMINVPSENWVIKPDVNSLGCVLAFVDTDEGITGESLVFTFGTQRLDVLNSMVLSLKPNVVGEDPHYTERVWQKSWRDIRFFGQKGISIFGVSAIDRACWDVVGKAAGKPLYKLLGAYRDEVPAYASGLWLSRTIEELVQDARGFLREGFRAIKMRIGKPHMEEDVDRVKAVRQAIGPDADLMVDAGKRFTPEHAIRLGRRLEEFNLRWFEEPVPAHDLDGSARVAAALDVPIASGESEYTRYGFREMMEKRAADILMPDLARVGGITEFRKVAHMAEACDILITPHIFPEESMQLVGAFPNAIYVESMPWFSPLYREKMELKNGMIMLPQRPGLGFTFNLDVVERFRIRS
jgi:L-alanine-DL-glutamate epimerase-like enolase superfamily enzyme